MLKVTVVVGTRPEAIKMAPVIRELQAQRDRIHPTVISTGQHRQMLDSAFGLFGIRPDFDLAVMRPNQSLAGLTAALVNELDRQIASDVPHWILGQGDTSTVLAASLVAFYRGIRFGHVEAGLRTGDLAHPFPEELNRRVADLVSSLYFAPTLRARDNLLREGVPADQILVTGNTVVDALLSVSALPFDRTTSVLSRLPAGARLVLVTAHRRESFGQPFRDLCEAIRDLASTFSEAAFVYPVHLNPNVRTPVMEILQGLPNVYLVEPFDYLEMVQVMKASALILTDSGGIQEEAPTFGVPVLVMRQTTERPEGVEAGFVTLVGTDRRQIVAVASEHLAHGSGRLEGKNPYGDGQAARRIVTALLTDYRA